MRKRAIGITLVLFFSCTNYIVDPPANTLNDYFFINKSSMDVTILTPYDPSKTDSVVHPGDTLQLYKRHESGNIYDFMKSAKIELGSKCIIDTGFISSPYDIRNPMAYVIRKKGDVNYWYYTITDSLYNIASTCN